MKQVLRQSNRKGLRSHYIMVEREPLEGKKARYTKLVTRLKAQTLIHGRLDMNGTPVHSSRRYRQV